jgi:hypothetical protein
VLPEQIAALEYTYHFLIEKDSLLFL